ncbi:MAG: branched-chain amino acid ABC transporter substrate-binding protein [Chloroflexia bacterium]
MGHLRARGWLLLLLCGILAACGPGPRTVNPDTYPYSGEIRIGYAGPLSGSQAAVGIDLWHGAELAALHYNRQGGVLGRKVVVVPLDDQADSEVAVEVARRFVEMGVAAVVGHYSSGATMPASRIYAEAGILQVTTMASNPAISQQGFRTFFRVCPVDSVQGPVDAEFAVRTLGKRRIAIVYIGGDTYSEGLREEFARRAQELGATIAGAYPYVDGTVDFTPIVEQIRAEAPELVFFSGYYPGGDILLRQMYEAGLSGITFLSGDGSFEYGFLRDAGKAAEGAYVSSLFPDVLASPQMKDWVEEFRTLYRYQPGINSPAGYAALQVILEGMRAAGTTDAQKVAEAIRGMTIQTPYGPLRYDEKGDLIEQKIPIFVVRQGQFVEWTPQD